MACEADKWHIEADKWHTRLVILYSQGEMRVLDRLYSYGDRYERIKAQDNQANPRIDFFAGTKDLLQVPSEQTRIRYYLR
jgi:hypothetical protein